MHYIVRATIPVMAGNELVKGNMDEVFNKVMGDVRPEAAYFAIENGQRTLYLIVNVEAAEETTRIAEPLWLSLEADVEFIPVMTQEDFGKAAPIIADIASRY